MTVRDDTKLLFQRDIKKSGILIDFWHDLKYRGMKDKRLKTMFLELNGVDL